MEVFIRPKCYVGLFPISLILPQERQNIALTFIEDRFVLQELSLFLTNKSCVSSLSHFTQTHVFNSAVKVNVSSTSSFFHRHNSSLNLIALLYLTLDANTVQSDTVQELIYALELICSDCSRNVITCYGCAGSGKSVCLEQVLILFFDTKTRRLLLSCIRLLFGTCTVNVE